VDDTGAIWARQQSGFLLRIDPNRNAVVERVAAPASLSACSSPATRSGRPLATTPPCYDYVDSASPVAHHAR